MTRPPPKPKRARVPFEYLAFGPGLGKAHFLKEADELHIIVDARFGIGGATALRRWLLQYIRWKNSRVSPPKRKGKK